MSNLMFRCLSSVKVSAEVIAICLIKSNRYDTLIYEVIFIKSVLKENISQFF
jgi:hypothetical protein